MAGSLYVGQGYWNYVTADCYLHMYLVDGVNILGQNMMLFRFINMRIYLDLFGSDDKLFFNQWCSVSIDLKKEKKS